MELIHNPYLEERLMNRLIDKVEKYVKKEHPLENIVLDVYYGIAIEDTLKKAIKALENKDATVFWEFYENENIDNSSLILLDLCKLNFKKQKDYDTSSGIFKYAINLFDIYFYNKEGQIVDNFNIIRQELKNYIH